MMSNYNILHLHSDYSNGITSIDSVTKFDKYIEKAKEQGMTAIAFTEHGCIFDWFKKKQYCEDYGLKYIHAVEMYITKTLNEKIRDNYHCCMYAKNYKGFLELNALCSKSFNREDGSYYYSPRITVDDLLNTSENIIITSACLGGFFNSKDDELEKNILDFMTNNKERCFLEIQHHLVHSQINLNKKLYDIHLKTGLRCITGTDTHCLNEKHAKGRVILQKAKNIHFGDEDGWDLTFKTYDELLELYKKQNIIPIEEIKTALNNTIVLSDMVEEFSIDSSYKYPKLYEDGLKVLKNKINEGILEKGINKYSNYKSEYIPRIKYELETYIHNGAVDFLLLDEDIKSWARERDIFPGYSRGSVSGSEIAYIIGMTDIDSIKHKMNFERFMNVERVSLADVDTDWQPNHRELVKDYIYNKEGLYCADIVTFNTVALKGSVRDVGRALEIPLDEVNEICSNIEINEEKYRKKYKELFEYVDIINGTIVSIGTHPCFTGEQLILTNEGYKEIKDLNVGDEVLTHNNNYKKVVDVMINKSDDIYEAKPCGTLPIKATGNHPFYVRKRKDKRLRKYKDGIDTTIKKYSSPVWMSLKDIEKGDVVGIPINNKSKIVNNEFDLPYKNKMLWWIVGRYLGDGWITELNRLDKRNNRKYIEKHLIICCNKNNNETNDIVDVLKNIDFNYRIEERATVNRIYIKNNDLLEYLKTFGKYADGKFIPNEVLNLPKELLEEFLNGYLSADGYCDEVNSIYSFKTVSKKLALGFINCIAKVYNRHCKVHVQKEGKDVIEGRIVKRKEKYIVSFTKDVRKKERSFCEDGYIWMPLKSIERLDVKEKTYNLSVLDDNSYTVNNIAVHNCGTIVSPIPLDDVVGLCTISTCSHPVSMLSMKCIDAQNFTKLDILGLDNIQLINETCKLAGIERLVPNNVPDEEVVWKSMADNNLLIFQWESDSAGAFLKTLLSDKTLESIKKVNPNFRYVDLVSMGNGAIRPAGSSYRTALSNGEFKDNGHKALNDLLAPTMGYLVYQEQILEFLHQFCGYTMGEADVVRRGFAKKTGTEKFIPKIKEGFIKTMKDKYGVEKEESEEIIISFIQVINDASSYLFSLNHSEPYTYIGYICAYLRYYYPLEFLSVAFNINKDNQEKTTKITEYARTIGVKLNNAKYGYAKGECFFDKGTNSIYKGIGAIKNLNTKIGDELYELSQSNKFTDFFNLLIAIQNETSCNSRQLDILIKLGYFSEFGKTQKLLNIVDLYNKVYVKKQFKKDKLPDCVPLEILTKYANVETEKTLKDIRMDELMVELMSNIQDKDISIEDVFKVQMDYLGYIDYKNDKLEKRYVLVTSINTKYTPVVDTYCLNNGGTCRCKISKTIFKDKEIDVGDIIYIHNMTRKFGYKKVGEKEDKKGNVKPIFEQDESKQDWWITSYNKVDINEVLDEIEG